MPTSTGRARSLVQGASPVIVVWVLSAVAVLRRSCTLFFSSSALFQLFGFFVVSGGPHAERGVERCEAARL
jgi:hypothetical protein